MNKDTLLLQRAASYMEMLSSGIDPISGEILTDDTVLNNEKLSRCFLFVADVLKQLIDKGGLNAPEKKLQPFSITPEQRQKIFLYDKPIDISTFTRAINSKIDTNSMSKLSGTVFAEWLTAKGYIAKDGKINKPTPNGNNIGITLNIRETPQLVYSREAQQFLLTHLEDIISVLR